MTKQDLEASGLGIFLLCVFEKHIWVPSPQLAAETSQQCFGFVTRNLSKSDLSEKGHQVGDGFYEVYI